MSEQMTKKMLKKMGIKPGQSIIPVSSFTPMANRKKNISQGLG